jgi:hypothetical protein
MLTGRYVNVGFRGALEIVLMSEKCSNCGKSASEIERAWEEGSALDAEKRRKKLGEYFAKSNSRWREYGVD